MVTYIKGGILVKGIRKHDPESNISASEVWDWGSQKDPQWEISYFVPFIIVRIIKCIRLSWAGYVAWMEESKSSYKSLTDKCTGKRPLGRFSSKREDSIRMDLK